MNTVDDSNWFWDILNGTWELLEGFLWFSLNEVVKRERISTKEDLREGKMGLNGIENVLWRLGDAKRIKMIKKGPKMRNFLLKIYRFNEKIHFWCKFHQILATNSKFLTFFYQKHQISVKNSKSIKFFTFFSQKHQISSKNPWNSTSMWQFSHSKPPFEFYASSMIRNYLCLFKRVEMWHKFS